MRETKELRGVPEVALVLASVQLEEQVVELLLLGHVLADDLGRDGLIDIVDGLM